MMLLTRRTLILLATFAGFLLLVVVDQGSPPTFSDALPILDPLPAEEVQRIEMSTSAQKITLQLDAGSKEWQVVAPFQAKADQARIKAFLAMFQRRIPLDVQVDTGNLEKYGLDAGNGIVAELWTDPSSAKPALSYTVGFDGPGGSTFIRLSGDEAVYRAQVGSRALYEQPPIAWRNQVLLDYEYLDATAVVVSRGGQEGLRLVRGSRPGLDQVEGAGAWEMDPPAPWPVDQRTAEGMVRQLGQLRASAILPADTADAGLTPPRAEIAVTLNSGEVRRLGVGAERGRSGVLVRVGGSADIYQTAASVVAQALQPPSAFRELTIFSLSVEQVDTFTLEAGASRVILQQGDGKQWTVLQPANMDVDVGRVYIGINNFIGLRAQAVSDMSVEQAGLLNPEARITARLQDGSDYTLEVGLLVRLEDGSEARLVRRSDSTQVYVLPEDLVQKMKAAFNQL